MGYVLAGYAITLVSIVAYSAWVLLRARHLGPRP